MYVDYEPFVYDTEGCQRCWFYQMWEVDSWCEVSYIFDPIEGILWEWGYSPRQILPPSFWNKKMRKNISQLVCPD